MTFGDGSVKHSNFSESMLRCGRTVFSGHFDDSNILVRSAWASGPLPTKVHATPTAELYALYMYLRHAAPFEGLYIFHSDCSYVVDGWNFSL